MDRDIRAATNQPPPLVGHDVVTSDPALAEAVLRHGSPETLESLVPLGREAGTAEAREHGMLANQHPPQLTAYDRYGVRIDEVRFHPSWHWLMERAVGHGLQAAPWESERAPSARAPGRGLPRVVPDRARPRVPDLDDVRRRARPAGRRRHREGVDARGWRPPSYDPTQRAAADKHGALAGMGMTEKQGGSDVRSNRTEARPTAVDGEYTLHGHKWFTSAPMNDVFLVLAQAPEGLTCFVMPRRLPDGSRNPFDVVRLKDKLGNRSNASAELEFDGTLVRRLGDEGRGVRTIIEMVAATRLDCVLGSASLMRRSLAEASWHVAHRTAFGATAGRPAAHAERDRRPGRGVRGRDRARDPAGRGGGRRPSRARGGAAPDRAAPRQVLGLQADAGHGGRGARVSRRQRVRRGVGAAAALPRVAR